MRVWSWFVVYLKLVAAKPNSSLPRIREWKQSVSPLLPLSSEQSGGDGQNDQVKTHGARVREREEVK